MAHGCHVRKGLLQDLPEKYNWPQIRLGICVQLLCVRATFAVSEE